MAKVKLTKKREAWAAPRQDVQFKGDPMTPNMSAAARYEQSLDVLIREMRADYQREMMRLLRNMGITQDANAGSQARIALAELGRKWSKRFADRAEAIADRMITSVDRDSKSKLKQSLKTISGGLTISVPDMPAGMADIMKATLYENTSLITNIHEQYRERVEGIVYRSIQEGGRGAADIYDELIDVGGMSERRAHLVATDQTRKANAAFSAERAKAVGIRKAIWRHSGGSGEPRRLHVEMDGKEFDLDDPPAIGDKGEKVLPGQAINCKCTWTPVVDFDAL